MKHLLGLDENKIEVREQEWNGCDGHDVALPNGGWASHWVCKLLVSNVGLDLRAALAALAATEGLTPEQLEVARLEAELEQAWVEEVIRAWDVRPAGNGAARWLYVIMEAKYTNFVNDTRLEAARAAVAKVRELRAEAEAKRLPDPRNMTLDDVVKGLLDFDWHPGPHGNDLRPAWYDTNSEPMSMSDDETLPQFHRRALAYARAVAAKQ